MCILSRLKKNGMQTTTKKKKGKDKNEGACGLFHVHIFLLRIIE